MIDRSSRYLDSDRLTYRMPDGTEAIYFRRRLVPQAASCTVIGQATVMDKSRLDLIAAQTLGDPLTAWRIADANAAIDPADLTAVTGRVLRVPTPY